MSAKLEKSLAKKQVLIRKIVSGEVAIIFHGKDLKSIAINHNGVLDLMSRRGVTVEAIRASNLKQLIAEKCIEVI